MDLPKRLWTALLVLLVMGTLGWTVAETVGLEKLASQRAYRVFKRLAAGDPTVGRAIEHDFANGFPVSQRLRTVKGWVDWSLFRVSPVAEVYVGKDGWLFYRPELDDYEKRACGQAESMRVLAKDLQRIERIVESSGRRFLLTIAPNKSTIYPEYVGGIPQISNSCGKSRYDLLLESFREYPVTNFIRLDDRLRVKKRDSQVYYRTDTHWNPEGAGILVEELLLRILLADAPTSVVRSPFTNVGDLGTMMGLTFPESTLAPIPPDAPGRYAIDSYGSPRINHVRSQRLPGDNLPQIPATVLFHDSFMILPSFLLAGRFEELDGYWVWGKLKTIPAPRSEEALRHARLVIIEIVERDLGNVRLSPETFRRVLADSDLGNSG